MNANTAKHVRCPAWLRHPAMRHPCRSVLIRGQRRIPPGARQRPPWSWSGGWAGFDRVEQHPGDVEPELRIPLADARRAGDVYPGERTERRRVGEEWVRTCEFWLAPVILKKHT